MQTQVLVNSVNKATYERADVVKFYQNVDELLEAERVLFKKLDPVIRDSRILDIGVGGGRTTRYLLEISSDYTGVDYVAKYAQETARKYPEAKILSADATDLRMFESDTFDFILFSYNGIDSISNESRLKLIREANRVLRKGGIFMFSTHNRDYQHFHKLPWQREFHFSFRYLIFFLHCLFHLPNHFKMRKHEVFTDDYAIINDGDHRYSLLLYYITIEKQIKQLADNGFTNIEAYDTDGNPVARDTESHWLHYLAAKA